ncbi:ARM repeat-containing protein [Nemania sp. FL0031]|nr:ARM repeat-containing protein [Nemania sp. FL0031]
MPVTTRSRVRLTETRVRRRGNPYPRQPTNARRGRPGNPRPREPANSTSNSQQLGNIEQRKFGLHQVYSPPDDLYRTKIDIVAIHGLDTHSPKTWEAWEDGTPGSPPIHWLRHPKMLPSFIKNARIFTYDWNANYDNGAQDNTLLGHANTLLEHLCNERNESKTNNPIIFVASCFGGLLLIKALHRSREIDRYDDLLRFTAGAVFLGTPFEGSNERFYDATQLRIAVAVEAGSEVSQEMVRYLENMDKGGATELQELVRRFGEMAHSREWKFPIVCFHETHETDFTKVIKNLPRDYLRSLKGRERGILVPQHSACLLGADWLPLGVRHGMLNKYADPDNADFRLLCNRIRDLADKALETLRMKGVINLTEADDWIVKNCYAEDKLKIKRLSGKPLPMAQCYINLAIIHDPSRGTTHYKKEAESSLLSLPARLAVETPDKTNQVKLEEIFDKAAKGTTTETRRILIRGRAGVGKTTLCKKIVHDFVYCSTWKAIFERILWVPLRTLKDKPEKGYNPKGLFIRNFFFDAESPKSFAKELDKALRNSKYTTTLLVLDGLDEISENLYDGDEIYSLLQVFLKQPNVIVTCRPSVKIPDCFKPDLELETIGFYPEQITAYLETVSQTPEEVEQIRLFLQKHRLMNTLVRIPIQLDALCLIWDEEKEDESTIPETMTAIYRRVEHFLWKKDACKLEILTPENAEKAETKELEANIDRISLALECLAFNGMLHEKAEFQPKYLDKVLEPVNPYVPGFGLPRLLENVSFLRTSDLSTESSKRNYHFLHQTYQEYFAAKYFVRHWRQSSTEKLKYCVKSEDENTKPSKTPEEFLQKFKYTPHYNIFWRFVAGLLGRDVSTLFRLIEEKPLDLLGPVHQRLVMHCLSEIDNPEYPDSRRTIEKRLSQWLLFECEFASVWLSLASASEFPDGALRCALNNSSPYQKCLILFSLRQYNRHFSKEAVTMLEELLTHMNQHVRISAIEALGNQSDLPKEIVARLISVLEEHAQTPGDLSLDDFYYKIGQAVRNQSSLSNEATEALLELTGGENERIRRSAFRTLGNQSNLHNIIPNLVILLQDPGTTDEERKPDLGSLVDTALEKQLNLQPETVTTLIELLESADRSTKYYVAMILARQSNLEKIFKPFLTLLDKADEDEDRLAVGIVIRALKRERKLPETAVQYLVNLLGHSHFNIRCVAAEILANQSELPDTVQKNIMALAQDLHASTRYPAAIALKKQSMLPTQTINEFLQSLNGNSDLRHKASEALSAQSNFNQFARPLVKLLDTSDIAAGLLRAQPNLPEDARGALIQLLHENRELRGKAAEVLKRQSNMSTETIETLSELLANGDYVIRETAAGILGSQSQLPSKTIKTIAKILKDASDDSIEEAFRIEWKLPDLAVEVLRHHLEKGTKGQREVAIKIMERQFKALCSLSRLPKESVKVLVALLESRDSGARVSAATVLGQQVELSIGASKALISKLKEFDMSTSVYKILEERPNWPEGTTDVFLRLLGDADAGGFARRTALYALEKQSKLSERAATCIVTLLEDRNLRSFLTEAIGRQSVLMDKILDALSLLSPARAQTSDNKRLRINQSNLESLYGSFLCRGFWEQFWLEVNEEDSSLSICYPDGSRSTPLNIQSSDHVLNWRQSWNIHNYTL